MMCVNECVCTPRARGRCCLKVCTCGHACVMIVYVCVCVCMSVFTRLQRGDALI